MCNFLTITIPVTVPVTQIYFNCRRLQAGSTAVVKLFTRRRRRRRVWPTALPPATRRTARLPVWRCRVRRLVHVPTASPPAATVSRRHRHM